MNEKLASPTSNDQNQVERFEVWSVSHDGLAELARQRPGMGPTDFEQYVPVCDKDVFVRAEEYERLTRGMNGQADVMVAREREFTAALLRIDELERANVGLATESERRRAALGELHALVWGECSSLLNEDSGGDARLDTEIRSLIAERSQSAPETSAIRPPDGYAYRYPDGTGGVIRFNSGQEVNGHRPLEALPYWLGPAPPTKFPKQPQDCRHDLAMLKCSECGIDFSKVSVSSSPEKASGESREEFERDRGFVPRDANGEPK